MVEFFDKSIDTQFSGAAVLPVRIKLDFFKASVFLISFLILAVGGFMVYDSSRPYSLVTVDINPSIELKLDQNDSVFSAQAKNQDGVAILSKIKIEGESFDTAISRIVAAAIEQRYITSDTRDNAIMVGIGLGDEQKLKGLLLSADNSIQNILAQKGISASVEASELTGAQIDEARAIGISPGKLLLIDRLAKEKGISREEALPMYKDAKVKDIVKESNALKWQQLEKKTDNVEKNNGDNYKNSQSKVELKDTEKLDIIADKTKGEENKDSKLNSESDSSLNPNKNPIGSGQGKESQAGKNKIENSSTLRNVTVSLGSKLDEGKQPENLQKKDDAIKNDNSSVKNDIENNKGNDKKQESPSQSNTTSGDKAGSEQKSQGDSGSSGNQSNLQQSNSDTSGNSGKENSSTTENAGASGNQQNQTPGNSGKETGSTKENAGTSGNQATPSQSNSDTSGDSGKDTGSTNGNSGSTNSGSDSNSGNGQTKSPDSNGSDSKPDNSNSKNDKKN